MKQTVLRMLETFKPDVYPVLKLAKQYLSDAERQAIMLTAEGNVYLAMGQLCTQEEVNDMKRKVIAYVHK